MTDTTVQVAAPLPAALTPIRGPGNPAQGPSTGDSTENGDSWHVAVTKINAMFHHLFQKIEGPIEHFVTTVDTEAHDKIKELEDQIAVLQQKHDAMVEKQAVDHAAVTDPLAPFKIPPPATGDAATAIAATAAAKSA